MTRPTRTHDLPCPACRRDKSVRTAHSHGALLFACWRCGQAWGEPEYRAALERLAGEPRPVPPGAAA